MNDVAFCAVHVASIPRFRNEKKYTATSLIILSLPVQFCSPGRESVAETCLQTVPAHIEPRLRSRSQTQERAFRPHTLDDVASGTQFLCDLLATVAWGRFFREYTVHQAGLLGEALRCL